MKVKGIELFRMIKKGNIKNGTEIKVIYGTYNPIYIFINNCLYDLDNKEVGVSVLLSNHDFEILEYEIKEIEKIKEIREYVNYLENQNCIKLAKKVNELVRAVNKLNDQATSKEINCMTD